MSRLLPVLSLLIAGGVFFGYVSPTVSGPIAHTQALIKQYDEALIAADSFEQKKTQLTKAQQALPADALTRLKKFLPDNLNNVQLILDMDALATRSGVKLGGFNTSETAKSTGAQGAALVGAKPYDSLDLSVTAVGTYPAIRTFLGGVEKSLLPLDLVEFHVSDSATGVYTYQMTFRLYSLR